MYNSSTEQLSEETKEVKLFRLATVTDLFSDKCPKIRFFGEEAASEKKYKIIDGSAYQVNDTVLVAVINDGYVILGAINYDASSGGEPVSYLTLSEAQQYFASLAHTHSEYASTSHTHYKVQASSFYIQIMTYSGGSSGYGWIPSSGGNCDLGSSSYKYRTVYATTGTINTSDENQKHDIEDLDERYELLHSLLQSKRFKFNDGESDRYHTGFISQKVKEAMEKAKISDKEFAAFIKSQKTDEEGNTIDGFDYGLRYSEFIALNTMMIQKLMKKNENLEQRISELERRISNEQKRRNITSHH